MTFKEYFKQVGRLLAFTLVCHVLIMELFIPTRSVLDLPIQDLFYVQSIDTPKLNSQKVKKVLDKFNKMGYSKVVSYKRKFVPIWIFEGNLYGNTLGVALSTMVGCPIILDADKLEGDEKMIEHVIIHEYLHCLGYPHTYNPLRVMNDSYSHYGQDDYEEYANELLEKIK